MALAGGEDYVLLVTAEAARAEIIAQDFREAFGRPLHAIGEITAGRGLELTAPGGRSVPLKPSGWDHFRDGEPAINE
jgi:thiamine-monophosphate kinase